MGGIYLTTLLNEQELLYIKHNIDNYPRNKQLAERFNLTIKQLKDILYRNKIKRSYSNRGKVEYNKSFFETYTPLSCYWAGFLLADGCISVRPNKKDKFLTLNVSEKDKNHLEYFRTHLNSKNLKIITRHVKLNNKNFNYCSIILYNNKICNDLELNFNVIKNKSLRTIFPSNMPDEYKYDFIRGIIDGDGSISIYKDRGKNICRLSCVGNEYIMKYIGDYLNLKYSLFKNRNIYYLSYSFYNSCSAIIKLYFPISKFCLERKRDNFLSFVVNMDDYQKDKMMMRGIPFNNIFKNQVD